MNKSKIDKIGSQLQEPLPGWNAQKKLSPLITDKYREQRADSKKAGVMLLLFPDPSGDLKLYYIQRPKNPLDKHSGQISFPGGQKDSTDQNLIETSLRETEEELGIDATQIEVLGQISPLYVYASNFYVEPTVGFINHEPTVIPQASEVADVYKIPLSHLLREDAVSYIDYPIRNIVFKQMPYFDLYGEILWGATAMITSEFLSIVKSV